MVRPSLHEALKGAELIHDGAAIQGEIARAGKEVEALLGGESAVLLSVMHGGLIFAAQLALAIRSDLEFDYVHATRYRGTTVGTDLHWIRQPAVTLNARTIVLTDDILDEGKTLKAIRDFCLDRGARRVIVAVLCEKKHGRCVPGIVADVCAVQVPDRYVFGHGMDYHEQGRNLPGIYAL